MVPFICAHDITAALKFKANRPLYCDSARCYDIPLPFELRERQHVNVTSNSQ